MSNKENINYSEEDSIDLIAIVKTVWLAKKLIAKTTVLFFILGCIVALISPIVYTAQTTFVPQVSDEGMSSPKGLGSLASLAGINLNQSSSTSDSYVSPMLYSKITESDEFSMKLINEELIQLNEDRISIKDYLLKDKNSSGFNIIGFIKKYTIGLFTDSNKNEVVSSEILENYNFMSNEDYSLIKEFKQKFSIELNDKDGYIKVVANDKDAFISAQLAKLVTKNLQSRIISLRTNKVKEQLDYSKKQYEGQQKLFEALQNKVAEFKDSNKNISTEVFLSELQKLESEYQLQQNILISLASEYNNNKIKLNKNTPIFSVLDEVSVPIDRTKPKRSQLVLIYIFIGLLLSVGFILAKEPISNLIKEIKS